MTDELRLSVEHALRPEFVVGVNLTYRKISDIVETDLLVFDDPNGLGASSPTFINQLGRLHQRSDYVLCSTCPLARPGGLPNGDSYNRNYYVLRDGISTRGGAFLSNGDSEQEFKGGSITFNKRLANRWMMRGNVSFADWKWSKIPESSIEDPTFILGAGNRADARAADT